MSSRPDRTTMLARLRASTRLAVLVLLIFALKVGAAAACAKNDFAESNFGISGTHGVIVQATDTNAGDLSKTSFPPAGTCRHCGCHHATALPTNPVLVVVPIPPDRAAGYRSGLPPSTYLRLELRPPIA